MNHTDNSEQLTIEQVVDLFSAELRDGKQPTIADYKQRFPHLTEQIEAVLPALAMLNDVGDLSSAPKPFINDSIPQKLGEYHIIQEVGRGGMGIVFEAKHETMQRRVALKVLPRSATSNPTYQARFITEARSAGQLHHTNIVPVFEVGEDQDLHYYAMQFIHGENLDRVIEDLKRMRENLGISKVASGQNEANTSLSESVAERMLSGALSHTQVAPTSDQQPASNDRLVDRNQTAQDAGLSDSVFGSKGDSSTIIRSRDSFFYRVAAVGQQVADALEHAHGHGVLHRDVKPANLILDTDGTVWVTDFGLAKIDQDLTHTGDIVGTLRYMAPERFSGNADCRSDIYSLGLTLYELLTLHTAFGEVDRAKLVREVTNSSPTPPRKIDSTIPLDLETIVLKAIEPQADRRYQSAKEMSEDLRLFLADRPIQARRVSLPERFWRVCRRNPAIATMATCIVVLLLALAFGSLQFAVYSAKKTKSEIENRKESQRQLYLSKIDQARMRRYSNRLGQRFLSLAAIDQATKLLPELEYTASQREESTLELRNEATAALALFDFQDSWSASYEGPWGQNLQIGFDSDYQRIAEGHSDGRIRIRELNPAIPVHTVRYLPGDGIPSRIIKFSNDGRFLVANYHTPNALYRDVVVKIWDLQNEDSLVAEAKGVSSFDLSDDSRFLAVAKGNQVEILSLSTGEQLQKVTPEFIPRLIRFSYSGERIAISERAKGRIAIWNISNEPSLEHELIIDNSVTAMDWRSDREVLAAGTRYGELHFWRGDLELSPESFSVHRSEVYRVHIHPNGEMIASQAADDTVRLTDLISNQITLRVEESESLLHTGFSKQGQLCHFDKERNELAIWQPGDSLLSAYSIDGQFGRKVRFYPSDHQIVAVLTNEGIHFWNLETRDSLDFMKVAGGEDFLFTADGTRLFTAGGSGVIEHSQMDQQRLQ